jgi:hypothetical protein
VFVVALLCLAMLFVPPPQVDRTQPQELPPRLAKLLLEKETPPPPPPVKLNGKVTAKTISLKMASTGAKVRSVVEGTYKVAVTDQAKTQNFHLTGPGLNRKTGIKARTKATWTVALKPGTYRYRSDRTKRLRGSFTVTAKPA